ncbi:MAG: GNAT family N-acetyltransferase [Promethearchaeota archaeon]
MDFKIIQAKNNEELLNLIDLIAPKAQKSLSEWLMIALFKPVLRESGIITIAIDNSNQVLGFNIVHATLHPDKFYFAYLHISKSFRNNNIATSIHQSSESAVMKLDCKKVTCTVDPNNLFSLKMLVNSFHWQIIEFKPNEYGEKKHRLYLSKEFIKTGAIKRLKEEKNEIKESTLVINLRDIFKNKSIFTNNVGYKVFTQNNDYMIGLISVETYQKLK